MFTISSSYEDYVKENDGVNVLEKAKYVAVLARFFWLLSRTIIVNKYKFKVPQFLGYFRIAKYRRRGNSKPIDWEKTKKAGKIIRRQFNIMGDFVFKWKWDIINKNTRLSGKTAMTFRPVVDWREKKIGSRGLNNYVVDSIKDPYMKPYDLAIIN